MRLLSWARRALRSVIGDTSGHECLEDAYHSALLECMEARNAAERRAAAAEEKLAAAQGRISLLEDRLTEAVRELHGEGADEESVERDIRASLASREVIT